MKTRVTDPLMTSVILVTASVCLGLGLLLQASRWSATPAYANLLVILSAPAWGLIYLLLGVVIGIVAAVDDLRRFSLWVHAPMFGLLVFWEVAFIVRWWTDDHTTIANVLAWSVYLFTAVRSSVAVAERHDRVHPRVADIVP